MIRYTLTCDQNHSFDSWFQSADAYDKLAAAGMVACGTCGSVSVSKALMAPAVAVGSKDAPAEAASLSAPASPIEAAMAEIRRKLETESDYVGMSFAAEARAMHEGTAPERSIWGEARPEEARALLEDGVQVVPLPFLPRSKTN